MVQNANLCPRLCKICCYTGCQTEQVRAEEVLRHNSIHLFFIFYFIYLLIFFPLALSSPLPVLLVLHAHSSLQHKSINTLMKWLKCKRNQSQGEYEFSLGHWILNSSLSLVDGAAALVTLFREHTGSAIQRSEVEVHKSHWESTQWTSKRAPHFKLDMAAVQPWTGARKNDNCHEK